ncbi:MAG: hypothetical protein ACYCZB_17875 [Acidiphilium sp.]
MNDVQNVPFEYLYNPGGLNNQKLALFGLLAQAVFWKKPVCLPLLLTTPVDRECINTIPLEELYYISEILSFCEENGIDVKGKTAKNEGDSWHFFRCGAGHLEQITKEGRMSPDDLAPNFFRRLIPKLNNKEYFKILSRTIFRSLDIKIATQLRIESDWLRYSDITLSTTVGTKVIIHHHS